MEIKKMEEKNIMTELEQMREQMLVLRGKLEKQEIVNDKMLRRTIKTKMSWIKKYVYFEFCIIPLLALLWLGIKEVSHLSWLNYAFVMVMVTIDAIWDYRINVASLKLENVENSNLTDTMHKLIDMKQMRAKSFYIMAPLCIVWLVWTGIEMWMSLGTAFEPGSLLESTARGGLVGLCIGAPIGFLAAIRIYRKMQRTNDSLIEQISDMSIDE